MGRSFGKWAEKSEATDPGETQVTLTFVLRTSKAKDSENITRAGFVHFPSASLARRMTDDASERLEALQEYADLGSGYRIAMRDLEIRGAGNILGREQSGTINKVGLNLYYQILGEAMEGAQGN